MVEELNPETLKEKIAQGPVVVDFWAPWCGPCRMLAPTFEKVSEQLQGKLEFAKINVQDHQSAASLHGVSGIPCLIVFKDGKEIDRIVGLLPEPALKQKLEHILAAQA